MMRKRVESSSAVSRITRSSCKPSGLVCGLFLSGLLVILTACGTQTAAPPPSTTSSGAPYNLHVAYFSNSFISEVVIKRQNLWKKYLPPGTTVTWDTQVSGPPVVANMLADKDQIGYLGDMPAFVAAAKRNIADIRLVANVAWSPTGHLCSVLLVRSNAPQFANLQQAMRWLNGKTIGVAGKGACGDRYITNLIAAEHIHANVEYLDPTIILTELKNGKLDAAETFQPHIAQLVDEGIGRVVTTGIDINNQDAWFIIMRKDFIDQHPAVALGWLKADIAAWQFIKAHPRKAFQEWQAAVPYYTTKQLWMSFYEQFPGASGASNLNTMVEYSFTPAIKTYIDKSYQFLYNDKILSINKPLPGAIYPKLEEEAVKEMGVSLPLMTFTGQPASAFKIGNSGS